MATTPILSPGKPHGRRSLVAAVHVVAKTERLHFLSFLHCYGEKSLSSEKIVSASSFQPVTDN